MYPRQKIDGCYFKTKGLYAFFIPIKVPYKRIFSMAEEAGLKPKEKYGPILESSVFLGYGWIGVEVENPGVKSDNVIQLSGIFEVYEHRGPYRTLGKAYRKVRNERPSATEFYNFYLDDPSITAPNDCRTRIFFR